MDKKTETLEYTESANSDTGIEYWEERKKEYLGEQIL